jgi:hypothetical protein
MSNKAKPRKHGLERITVLRKKTKLRKRRNKATARVKQAERQQKIQEAIVASGK